MKAVLISIQPKWVEKIASGEKTVEVRKERPNIETPFKCYIYCTKENKDYDLYIKEPKAREDYGVIDRLRAGQEEVIKTIAGYKTFIAHGRVIGEFVCDRIDEYGANCYGWYRYSMEETCLWADEMARYGQGKPLYGWHISDLKIYDKPKELSEFYRYKKCNSCMCGYESTACIFDEECKVPYQIKRPPQSWQYVEVEE